MTTPNPGSDEAIAQGCTCAVLDNCHGKFAPWPPNGWYVTAGCPVHAPGHSEPVDEELIRWEGEGGAA